MSKDLKKFIDENAYCLPIRDKYGDTHDEVYIIETDDLRTWMTGHVRVPVEPTEAMIEAGCKQNECQQQDTWYSNDELSEYDCKAIYKAILNASKGK